MEKECDIYNLSLFYKHFDLQKEMFKCNIQCLDMSIAFYLFEYPNNKLFVPPFPEFKNQIFSQLFSYKRSKILNDKIEEICKKLNFNSINTQEIKYHITNKIKVNVNKCNLLLIDLCPNYFVLNRRNVFDGKIIYNKTGNYEDQKEIINLLIDKKHWLINLHNDNVSYSSLVKEVMGISEFSRGIIRDWRDNPDKCKILNMKDEWKIENYINFIGNVSEDK